MPEFNEEAIEDLNRRWAEAEVRGDIPALDAMSTDDFRLVGPAGFVLDKRQWLDRYRNGDLVTRSLRFEDAQTRLYGDAAVSIGRHVQQAEYQGHPVNGEFRSTHIAVREGDGWRLAGFQLSPIGGPPPFAPPGAPAQPRTGGRPELNHIIVAAHDKVASAEFLAGILGLPVGPPAAQFVPLTLSNGVTLDYLNRERVEPQHCAFLVSEQDFDAAFGRIEGGGVNFYAEPDRSLPGQINHRFGGRGVYFDDPNGHLMEILTATGD
jgi:ketosteroid isomerase-like protein